MKPAAFDYVRPKTVAEATELLARAGTSAAVIAGECVDMISDIPLAREVVERIVKEASALLAGSNRYRVA